MSAQNRDSTLLPLVSPHEAQPSTFEYPAFKAFEAIKLFEASINNGFYMRNVEYFLQCIARVFLFA